MNEMSEPRTGATFSDDNLYRYKLWRTWQSGGRWVNFLMLNPSTADELVNDPTVERCERRARSWGYDGLVVTNIFAFRATDPKEMKRADDPVGPDNDRVILEVAKTSAMVICAWGNHGGFMRRSDAIRRMLSGLELHCLRCGKLGEPGHPLYIGYKVKPVIYV